MRCPHCDANESRVLESRTLDGESSLRRRRECVLCARRFTTYERIETVPLMVVKRDGSRQAFAPNKIISGLMRACVRCPVSASDLEAIAQRIEQDLTKRMIKEIASAEIGEMVLEHLLPRSEVAYVRFASVYRHFEGVEDFISELQKLQHLTPAS